MLTVSSCNLHLLNICCYLFVKFIKCCLLRHDWEAFYVSFSEVANDKTDSAAYKQAVLITCLW